MDDKEKIDFAVKQKALEYKLNRKEAKALWLALTYIRLFRKNFPDQFGERFGKGDPRRKLPWKIALKLINEIEPVIGGFQNFPLYFKVQFEMLKCRKYEDKNRQPMIQMSCMYGERAVARWWWWKLNQAKTDMSDKSTDGVTYVDIKPICRDLAKAKEFIKARCGGVLNKTTATQAVESKAIFRYVAMKQVPVHYLLLSPIVKKHLEESNIDLLAAYNIDLKVYRAGVTPVLAEYFSTLFSHEWDD